MEVSTVYSDKLCEKELEILVDDENDAQSQYQKLVELRPEVRNQYSSIMNCVDKADQYILTALSPNRKKHWSTAQKLWEITMILIVNCRKLHESATGLEIRGPEWQQLITRCMLGLLLEDNEERPPSISKKSQGRVWRYH